MCLCIVVVFSLKAVVVHVFYILSGCHIVDLITMDG